MSSQELWDGITDTSTWEWIAIGASVAYVLLAANQRRVCWYFAGASSIIYVYLCYTTQLFMESLLQLFYVAMAIFGWYQWRSARASATPIRYSAWRSTLRAIVVLGLIAVLLGFTLGQFTTQAFPYLDSLISIFSVYATFLVARKAIENWVFFIVIDALSVYLYASRGLESSALLYVLFTITAIYGWWKWHGLRHTAHAIQP